jgi:mannosyltransferase OCH1-like enzyme
MSIIPRQIFQIALGEAYRARLPLDFLRQNILNKNSDYSYTLLTETDAVDFLETHYPLYLNTYNTLERVHYKSDLLRYLYLHKYGGVYVDIDLLPVIPFDSLLQKMECSLYVPLGAHHNGKLEVANGFIGSIPNHPLWMKLVDEMVRNPNPGDYGANVKYMRRALTQEGYSVQEFTKSRDVYFLREVGPILGKYYILLSPTELASFSNGHNYPFQIPQLPP